MRNNRCTTCCVHPRRAAYDVLWLGLLAVAFWGVQEPFPAVASTSTLTVEFDFPGGSAIVEKIDQKQRVIAISPSSHPGRGWECWWYIKVSGIRPGETLTLDVGGGVWATPDRCCFSLDGKTWRHSEPGASEAGHKRIVYRLAVDADEAWFAWGPPFVPDDAEKLISNAAAQRNWVTPFELCKTRGGRSVPAMRIKQPGVDDDDRFGIWVQARQHAWESGSSWVCRGFVDWLFSDDPQAEQLRATSEIVVVPIMDVDNVAIGAGGKNEQPQDHNRDWTDEPHWASVAAAQRGILKMNEGGHFHFFVDLHNPDRGSKNPYFYVASRDRLSETGRSRLACFLDAAEQEMIDPLAYVGRVIESGANYDKRWPAISKNWVAQHCSEHVVAVTLETAWNTPHSHPTGYLHVGKGLGLAMARYLRTDGVVRNQKGETAP